MKNALSWTSLAVLGLLAVDNSALAYEPSTHRILSELAFDQSKLTDPTLFNDLGFNSATPYRSVSVDGLPRPSQTPRELVGLGAMVEDTAVCTDGWMRVFNHFFDPQHGGRGLEFGATNNCKRETNKLINGAKSLQALEKSVAAAKGYDSVKVNENGTVTGTYTPIGSRIERTITCGKC